MLVIGESLYLTNLPNTEENINKLQSVLVYIKELKNGFRTISKGFNHVALSTIARLVKNKVNLRPALLLPKQDGGYRILHRPFLGTEKSFEDTRKHIHLAARALNS